MAKRSPERTEYLSDMLDTALNSIGYWAEVQTYWLGDEPTADIYVPDEEETYHVTLDTMAHGIQVLTTGENRGKAFSMGGMSYWKQFLLSNRTNYAEGDYDGDIADNVLQAGLFGKVVYG